MLFLLRKFWKGLSNISQNCYSSIKKVHLISHNHTTRSYGFRAMILRMPKYKKLKMKTITFVCRIEEGWDFEILGRIWIGIIFSALNTIKYFKTKFTEDHLGHSVHDRIIARLFYSCLYILKSCFSSKFENLYKQGKKGNSSTKRKRGLKNIRFYINDSKWKKSIG